MSSLTLCEEDSHNLQPVDGVHSINIVILLPSGNTEKIILQRCHGKATSPELKAAAYKSIYEILHLLELMMARSVD